MKLLKNVVLGILNLIFRVSVTALAVVLVYRFAMYSYHFGYMVFADAAKEPEPGRDIVITAENTEDVLEVGKMLQNRGIIEDAKIFFVQERLSDFHGKMMPGTYTLNTSMKAGQILEIMAESYVDEENPEGEQEEESLETTPGPGSSETAIPGQDTVEEEGQGYYDPETGEYIEPEVSQEEMVTQGQAPGQSETEDASQNEEDTSGQTQESGTNAEQGQTSKPAENTSGTGSSTGGNPFSAGAGI